MSSVLKGRKFADRFVVPDLCHLSSDSEGRRSDGVFCCPVVHSPDDASGLNVGAHVVHRRIAKGSGCGADALGEFCHHLVHLVGVDLRIVPCHAVISLAEHPTDLSVSHAANELRPWGLTFGILNASDGGIVEELVVADPQRSVPSFVVCPTVVGLVCCGHVVRLFL